MEDLTRASVDGFRAPRLLRAAAVGLLVLSTLVACSPSGAQLPEQRVRDVAENMAAAWSACDFSQFSRDWIEELRNQTDVAAWQSACESNVGSSGAFASIQSLEFVPSAGVDTERWHVTIVFENETDVLTLVLRPADGRVEHFNEAFGANPT